MLLASTAQTQTALIHVQKRDGRLERASFDKITQRLERLAGGLNVDCIMVVMNMKGKLFNGIKTSVIDNETAKTANGLNTLHPDYDILAGRVIISNIHKTTPSKFSVCMGMLQDQLDPKAYAVISTGIFDDIIDEANISEYNYIASKYWEMQYLMSSNGKICDRPQYVFMRQAIATSRYLDEPTPENFAFVVKSYKYLEAGDYTGATPTILNSCKRDQQLASCFLNGTHDSLEGIMDNLKRNAQISKRSGGIGIHMHGIRAQGQLIKSTQGKASGIPRQLEMYNGCALTFDQGGKRKGAMAIYLEPWHADIQDVLKLKSSLGDSSMKAKDLFYSIWCPDYYVKCYEKNKLWWLMSEDICAGLSSVYDGMEVCTKCNWCINPAHNKYVEPVNNRCAEDSPDTQHVFAPKRSFKILYKRYVSEGKFIGEPVPATQIHDLICEIQRETGIPYICHKDHVNRQSNQKNIGTIKSSNLCTEITQYSSDVSFASCVLGSINLKNMVVGRVAGSNNEGTGCYFFDYEKLRRVSEHLAEVLDNLIDNNVYPVEECIANAKDYRAIALGIQGLADVYFKLRIPFDSPEAEYIDVHSMETIYYGALTTSVALARRYGSYSAYAGSPSSRGLLKPDLWKANQDYLGNTHGDYQYMWDWDALRAEMAIHGRRNSLLTGPMPTVSSSVILGNNESFEPCFNNFHSKKTIIGAYTFVNSYLIKHLIELGIYNEALLVAIMNNSGSPIGVAGIPIEVANIYKNIFEIKQTYLMARANQRARFIDQSQSLNIHVLDNSNAVLRGVFLAGWKLGLTTGNYYIRTRSAVDPLKNNKTSACEGSCSA